MGGYRNWSLALVFMILTVALAGLDIWINKGVNLVSLAAVVAAESTGVIGIAFARGYKAGKAGP